MNDKPASPVRATTWDAIAWAVVIFVVMVGVFLGVLGMLGGLAEAPKP